MKQTKLVDANVIIRFLVRDHEKHFLVAKKVFTQAQNGEYDLLVLDMIVAEIIYVLESFYKHSKKEIVYTLKRLFDQNGIKLENKILIYEALSIYKTQNIDFADVMLCAKRALERYEIVSFDRKVQRC